MENRLAVAIAALVALVALAAACGDTPAPISRRVAPIVGGSADSGDPAVVAIGLPTADCGDSFPIACSGTLIAPRVVLTAAHCVAGMPPGTRLEVYFGADLSAPSGALRSVVERSIHPAFDRATNTADLALLLLETAAPVAAVAVRTTPLDATLVGASIRLVGFGASVAGAAPDGVKRQGWGVVTAVEDDWLRYAPDPAMTCGGDSGGPAFVADGAGESLAGVLSYGDPACLEFGVNVRVDLYYADFIAPFIAMSESLPDPPPPTIRLDQLCEAACVTRDDCPLDLDCLDLPGGARCVRGGLTPGTFDDVCSVTEDVCALCARISSAAGEPCRRYTPCDSELFRPGECSNGGCELGGTGRSRRAAHWLVIGALLALCACRPRR